MIDWKLAEQLWNEPITTKPTTEMKMVKRAYNMPQEEPENAKFEKPSEKDHLLQVTNVFTSQDNPFKNGLPDDVVSVQLEVVGGEEAGRTMLNRLTLDDTARGFFATRLFLKAIGEEHKGQVSIDTDRWIGRQFYATVKHNDGYANIDAYDFTKVIDQYVPPVGELKNPGGVTDPSKIDIAWEE